MAAGRGRGQIAPGPQAPRGLVTLNASRSGGLIKYTSISSQSLFLDPENFLLASLAGGLTILPAGLVTAKTVEMGSATTKFFEDYYFEIFKKQT